MFENRKMNVHQLFYSQTTSAEERFAYENNTFLVIKVIYTR